MFNPALHVAALTPGQKQGLEQRYKARLIQIIGRLWGTTFYRESFLLSYFRETLDTQGGPSAKNIYQIFSNSVPLSAYEDYRCFISLFFHSPCRSASVRDLLAPGFPSYMSRSSNAISTAPKYFPKYLNDLCIRNSGTKGEGSTCKIVDLRYLFAIDLVNSHLEVLKKIPICPVSSGIARMTSGLHVEKDEAYMRSKDRGETSPYAAYFVPSYLGALLTHGLFALLDQSLISFQANSTTQISDMITLLEMHWNGIIEAIHSGKLPTLYDLGNTRPCLEVQFKANPSRASELQSIKPSVPGWLKEVWPSLTILNAGASGVFMAVFPKLRRHFGPSVAIQSSFPESGESIIGIVYDAANDSDLDLYKITGREYIEYLEIDKPGPDTRLYPAWEIQAGHQYELVTTNQDGLWRYKLRDVVEVVGFDPSDCQPLVRKIERQGVPFQLSNVSLSECELRGAVQSVESSLGQVLEFAVEEDRCGMIPSLGIFLETDQKTGKEAEAIPSRIQNYLCGTNSGYQRECALERIGNPIIMILKPGTFMIYRQMRSQRAGEASKVNGIMPEGKMRECFTHRVICEIGATYNSPI